MRAYVRSRVRESMKTQKQPQLILPGALLEAWREAAYRKTTEAQCAHSKRSFM